MPLDGALQEADARLLKHGYLASVSYVDAQIGRLLARLDELGIADSTLVVLWGDNGYKLGDHGSWCKMTNFETDTRVPLVIKAPGMTGRRRQLVEFVDINWETGTLTARELYDHRRNGDESESAAARVRRHRT